MLRNDDWDAAVELAMEMLHGHDCSTLSEVSTLSKASWVEADFIRDVKDNLCLTLLEALAVSREALKRWHVEAD